MEEDIGAKPALKHIREQKCVGTGTGPSCPQSRHQHLHGFLGSVLEAVVILDLTSWLQWACDFPWDFHLIRLFSVLEPSIY